MISEMINGMKYDETEKMIEGIKEDNKTMKPNMYRYE